MVTDQQVLLLSQRITEGRTQQASAAGMSARSTRRSMGRGDSAAASRGCEGEVAGLTF